MNTTDPNILILFAHPALEKSRIHRRFLEVIHRLDRVTLHDLYEEYPDYDIDVAAEKLKLVSHDIIVMQHPFYWYSTPPLLKQWQDLVLEHGWAYGSGGTALRGKRFLNVVTTGGGAAAYSHEGHNRFTVRELLAPIEQTARLCGMIFLPPYCVFGAHRMSGSDIAAEAERYAQMLQWLLDSQLPIDALSRRSTLNELFDDHRTTTVTQ